MDINLNYVNSSNDSNHSKIVIFQKSVGTDYDELAVAWKVIQNCGTGENHPFVYPMEMAVACKDNDGNYTQRVPVTNGTVMHLWNDLSGNKLTKTGDKCSVREVDVLNDLDFGAMSAGIYKDDRLLALKTGVSPGEKAVFEFKPTIWVGVASQVVEGKVMNSAILSNINTEFSLLGISSADIVLSGGGNDPFSFTLENVVRA